MKRLDALAAIYDRLADCAVVTIMGAVAAELQSLGHRPNHFYLQHAMGLASSMGLGVALSKPQTPVVEESHSVKLAAKLADAGYIVSVHDPLAQDAAIALEAARVVGDVDPVAEPEIPRGTACQA